MKGVTAYNISKFGSCLRACALCWHVCASCGVWECASVNVHVHGIVCDVMRHESAAIVSLCFSLAPGMTLTALGVAQEYKGLGVAGNSIW